MSSGAEKEQKGDRYSGSELMAFKIAGVTEISIYLFLLAIALYNSYFFLYKQKRFRIYFISVFYGLAYVILLTRLVLSII